MRVVSLLLLLAGFALPSAAAQSPANKGSKQHLAAPAVPLKVVKPVEDDLLILALRLNKETLSEGMSGYWVGKGICLSLGELTRALDFPIKVDPKTGRAEGWFLNEKRRFVLDIKSGTVTLFGKTRPFDRGRVLLHPNAICVELSLLSAWFPIDFKPNVSDAFITIVSREPLPIELKLARQQRQARFQHGKAVDPNYPKIETPYQMWNWPVIDVFAETGIERIEGGKATRLKTRYDLLAVGDFLYMNGDLFIRGDQDQPVSGVRARLGRKDPNGGLLGWLQATEYTLGDMATPPTSLVGRSTTGRGVEISSFPLGQLQEFDRTTLRGELPIGWEVELYRNGALLDFQSARDDGRYEFIDVSVFFGRNEFELVFYGPQGQVRRETKETFVGAGSVAKGAHQFRFAVNQQGKDLISVIERENTDPDNGELRFVAQYETGIREGLSAHGRLFSLPLDGERRNYLTLGLGASLGGIPSGSTSTVAILAGVPPARRFTTLRFPPRSRRANWPEHD